MNIEEQELKIANVESLISLIRQEKDMFFERSRKLENYFFKHCYYILLSKNSLLFSENYIKCFEIIMKAVSMYKDVNAFYDIRLLMETRSKYLERVHDITMIIEYDICKYSKYLISYAYYYNIDNYTFDKMLNYLCNNYDELLDYCDFNEGSIKMDTLYGRVPESFKCDFYPYITNYILGKVNDKRIIK